jgi:hypothetical protein
VHLDDPQSLRSEAIQQTLDGGRFSGAARTKRENVIGWVSAMSNSSAGLVAGVG